MNAVEICPFATFQKVLLMSRKHPLAGLPELAPIHFRDELFFLPGEEDSPGRREALFATTEPYGFLPGRICTTPNLESAFFNVAAGLGVMIADMSTKYVQDPYCTYLRLPGDVPPCATIIAVRKRANQNRRLWNLWPIWLKKRRIPRVPDMSRARGILYYRTIILSR